MTEPKIMSDRERLEYYIGRVAEQKAEIAALNKTINLLTCRIAHIEGGCDANPYGA